MQQIKNIMQLYVIYRDIIYRASCIQIDEKIGGEFIFRQTGSKKIIGRSMELGWKKGTSNK